MITTKRLEGFDLGVKTKMIINIIITLACIIDLIYLLHIINTYNRIPKIILIPFICFTIISFIFISPNFFNMHILDIKHPVYSDPNGIGTISYLVALAGGLTLTCPFTIGYMIYLSTQNWRTARSIKKRGD